MRSIGYTLIILLAPFLILINFRLLVFSQNYYHLEFAKLGVYDQFQSKEVVDSESKGLISYLCCGGNVDEDFFTEKEILHMKDVKNLIKLAQIQLLMQAVVITICTFLLVTKKAYKILFNSLIWGSIVSIASVLVLGLSSHINFDFAFLKFHQLLFNNDLWLLPADSNLIKLFPAQFFADFANRIAEQTIVMAITIVVMLKFFQHLKIPKQVRNDS